MPDIVSDPSETRYYVLLALLIATGLIWLNRRGNRPLYVLFGVLVITLITVLFDLAFVSTREEAVRRVHAIMAAADQRDPEAFAAHIADRVIYEGEQSPVVFTRDQLRNHAFWSLLHQFNVHVAAWDFSHDDVEWPDVNTVVIGFLAKGQLRGEPSKQFPYYFRATFTRQGDGQMKLTRLESFDPMQRKNKRLSIPGLGG